MHYSIGTVLERKTVKDDPFDVVRVVGINTVRDASPDKEWVGAVDSDLVVTPLNGFASPRPLTVDEIGTYTEVVKSEPTEPQGPEIPEPNPEVATVEVAGTN